MVSVRLPNASNAVLAKARAMYGCHLTDDDYRRLASCHSTAELTDELKALPLYSDVLTSVSPAVADRTQLETQLRQSILNRYESLCRYDLSAGSRVYRYFIVDCEIEEILACLRCIAAGRAGDYLFRLPDFLQRRCAIDLYALAKATDPQGLLTALAGTRYAKLLQPVLSGATGMPLVTTAENVLEDERHRALVALAADTPRAKEGASPSVRDFIELECDIKAISNAARLIRFDAPAPTRRNAARRDCSALTPAQWENLLAASDLGAYKAALARTVYGPHLRHYKYSEIKEGLQRYQYDWCRKWLRFSTDPTMVMLCYTVIARCEVTNLDHIIEGVHYRMPVDELMPLLIGHEEGSVN